jgi:CheY-like chemotaxis protein
MTGNKEFYHFFTILNLRSLEKQANTTKVLLVEDNETDSMIVQKIMKLMNFTGQLVWVNSGQSAMEYLERVEGDNSPELILLDLHMPICDGWEFLKKLSQRPHLIKPDCRIYILTSSSSQFELAQVNENQLVNYVFSKPFTQQILEKIIEDPLQTSQN